MRFKVSSNWAFDNFIKLHILFVFWTHYSNVHSFYIWSGISIVILGTFMFELFSCLLKRISVLIVSQKSHQLHRCWRWRLKVSWKFIELQSWPEHTNITRHIEWIFFQISECYEITIYDHRHRITFSVFFAQNSNDCNCNAYYAFIPNIWLLRN